MSDPKPHPDEGLHNVFNSHQREALEKELAPIKARLDKLEGKKPDGYDDPKPEDEPMSAASNMEEPSDGEDEEQDLEKKPSRSSKR